LVVIFDVVQDVQNDDDIGLAEVGGADVAELEIAATGPRGSPGDPGKARDRDNRDCRDQSPGQPPPRNAHANRFSLNRR
jgi:hypothetical protein